EENTHSLMVRLDEWSKSSEIKPGETGRIIAVVLFLIVLSYLVICVARMVADLALPALVIMGLLLIYRCVTITETVEGIRQLPDIMYSFGDFLADLIRRANFL
ncbi:hypothetical protein KR032_011735, partial [Drosophila birchii]